jgi:hypothetical protein
MYIGPSLALPAVAALARSPYTSLIEPGEFSATLTRAQTSTVATGTDTSSAIVEYASADTPRWTGASRRLLIETQRTNSIRNPRCEGATTGAVGSGGALPTGWSSFSFPSGITITIVGTGTESGISYVDVRISGTPGASATGRIQFEAPANITASTSQAWAATSYVGLAPTSPAATNATLQAGWIEYTSAIVFVQNSFSTITPTTAALKGQRWVRQASTAAASTARIGPALSVVLTSGAAVDFTLRIGGPQCEQGTTASSLILPPVGSPAASTRGQDFVTANFASLFPSGAGTLLMAGSLVDASVGANQTLAQIDDGSGNNRVLIRSSSSGTFQVLRVTGGVSSSATGAAISDATLFRCGMAFDGAGRVAASLNGAAAIAVTGGPTSGLTTPRLGYSDVGALVQSGEFGPVRAYSYAMSDADLAAAVAAL